MKRGALSGGICGLAAAALALTACSSNSAGSGSPTASGSAAAANAAAGTSTAHGTPINLAFLSEFSTQGSSGDGWAGIQAAIRYVNAHGGIKGRPLAAQECVDNNDPNLAAACATKAAGNASIIASVGQTTLQGAVVDPVFEQAALPIVGANAFVSADFNAPGGSKGRPLAAPECVDNHDPNLAAACATKAAGNASIIASVGQTTLQGAVVDPVFEQAALPIVGANAFVSADFNAPNLFALHIGGLAGLGGVAAAADLLHAKKVSFVYVQSPAAATEVGLVDSAVLTPRHLPPATAVGVSPTAGDLSAAVAKAGQGSPGAIIVYTGQAQANSFIKAARQQGVTTPIIVGATLETPAAVQQQLGSGQNLYFWTSFKHSGSFYDAFLSQWQAAGNSPSLADEFAINGWLSVTMFADVARTLPTVTRASVQAAFSKVTNYTTGGMLPPLSFTKPGTALGGKAPRIVNPTMGLAQYQNGTFVPIAGGTFTNPFVVP